MPDERPIVPDGDSGTPADIGFPVRRSPDPGDRSALRQMIYDNPDAILVVDGNVDVCFCNPAAEVLFGRSREELLDQAVDVPLTSEDSSQIEITRSDGSTRIAEIRRTRTEMEGRDVTIVSLRDISDRVRLETELRQAQKLEALGRLAGGVAHDFNNILTVIMTSAELLRGRLKNQSAEEGLAAQIVSASETAADMTHKLLTFSRDKLAQAQTLDVNREISATLELLRRLVGEHIEFQLELTPEAPRVHLAASDLQQILINLVVNARDAMRGGGSISISTSVITGSGEDAQGDASYVGRYARVTVEDTGCGMDDQTRAKIFEPFFSTKRDKSNSGLGLATVYGIVRQAHGHIRVNSRPSEGTCFYVDLPLWDEAVVAVAEGEVPVEAEQTTAPPQVALVAEDQDQIRALVSEILEGAGYTVRVAHDGNEAMALAKEIGSDLTLLVTDLVLPGTTGAELCQAVRDEIGDVPIVAMSGYVSKARELVQVLGDGVVCLPKPFTPAQLLKEVETASQAVGG